MNSGQLWRYYFWQLPCYVWGGRSRMPDRIAQEMEQACQAGAAYLRECLGGDFIPLADAEIARRASWVRLWRESGAYSALLPSQSDAELVQMEGGEHLLAAASHGRPLILLTAHLGNPYLACATIATAGNRVFPVARAVDHSPATPRPVRYFLHLNYWATERKLNRGHYLYTDFAGKLDKRIVTVLRQPGAVCVNLIDMPATLYESRRHAVRFLGRRAELPISFIEWACKKKAVFLTFWNGFSADFSQSGGPGDPGRAKRWVRIEAPIGADTAEAVLQVYADRLTSLLAQEPWQWMGLPIASQFHQHACRSGSDRGHP